MRQACPQLALNVVCCETALRLELGSKRKCPACARNDVDDPGTDICSNAGGTQFKVGTSAFDPQRTSGALFDYLVSGHEKCLRHREGKRLGGLQINDEFEFC
jgi:hypothetical protein